MTDRSEAPRAAQTWRPTATRATLEQRAALLARARRFFFDRGVLEVDTPVVVNAAVTDVHIHSARVHFGDHTTGHAAHDYFLHTSPEYAMKRLLADGSGDIYQICHVVRALERGRQHNTEFTLIEWYRIGFSLHDLMSEVETLVRELLGERLAALASERFSYREVFLRELQLDPFTASLAQLQSAAETLGLQSSAAETLGLKSGAAETVGLHSDAATSRTQHPARSPAEAGLQGDTTTPTDTRDDLLDLLMGAIIGPRLGQNALTFVHGYPASQAALARLDPIDPRAASRFELYCKGMELANGFHELASAAQQRARFLHDNVERSRRGLPSFGIDERLLEALESGLPDCAGVALGFDRTVMLATGAGHIDAVLPFPTERA